MIKAHTTRFVSAAMASFAIFSGASQAHASNADWGYVTGIYAMSTGAVLFNTSGTRTSPPACQNSLVPARYALDGSTVAGQAQIAILINAHNLHKKINLVGQNACTIWGDTETVAYFLVED